MGRLTRILTATSLLVAFVDAFYLPGSAPHDYQDGERVELFVNALTPIASADRGKLKSVINYDYYHPSFQFCKPEGGEKKQPESLGSILFGDRIFNSPYDIEMLRSNSTCRTLCTTTVTPENATFINDRIKEDYALNWLIDGLPAAEMKEDLNSGEIFFDMGFNLGDDDNEHAERPALNNHYDIYIRYHKPYPDVYRVVGVLVWPSSIGGSQTTETCESTGTSLLLSEDQETQVRYTYRILWTESDTPWATRWDNYLHIFDPRIHWLSLINSMAIVVFLCIMVAMILYRNIARDISRYNASDLSEDVQEDFGWKLVHGEVFRSPQNPLILAALIGNGAQLCAMVGVTLVFALLGFLSPSNRGSLATVMIVCWTFFGSVGGYISSRLYASMGGTDRRKSAFITATVLPTAIFAVVFMLNFILIIAGSSGAVPFGTMLFIVVLWFGISAPLSWIGSYFGNKSGTIKHPVRVNSIPRQIPPGPKYLRPYWAAILSGILPFGAAFIELYFILTYVFASRTYYAFGFLALTSIVVSLTIVTVTILFTYFQLCAEEYRWHWRSFLAGGGSAFWLLLYGLYYMISMMSLDSLTSIVLYMGYLFLLVLLDFLITGTIGFVASYWAVRRLYSSIRID